MLGVCRAVLVRIEVPSPIALEPFKIASKLGRFVLRDEGVPSPPPQWITHPAGGNKLASQRPCHAAPYPGRTQHGFLINSFWFLLRLLFFFIKPIFIVVPQAKGMQLDSWNFL